MINIILLILLWNSIFNQKGLLYCGILGFSGYKGKTYDLMKIKYLLFHNSVERGLQSTGIYTPTLGVIKKAEKAEDFLIHNNLNIVDSLLIGHVRYATSGQVVEKNAHPFHIGNIVGVHNGSLTNHWDLCTEAGLSLADYNVDSEVLFALINKDQKFNPLSKILGSMAIICTDVENKDKPMYCFRNSERPLFKGFCEEGMYISSIEESLKVIGCIGVKEFKEQCLYTIKEGKIVGTPVKLKKAYPKFLPVNTYKGNRGIGYGTQELEISNKLLVGKWIKCINGQSTTFNGKNISLTEGKYYFVREPGCITEKGDDFSIIVRDDSKKPITVTKHYFDFKEADLKVNGYAILMCDIPLVDDKDKPCGKLDEKSLFLVDKIYNNKTTSVRDEKTQKHYTLEICDLRKASDEEAATIFFPDEFGPVITPPDGGSEEMEDYDIMNITSCFIESTRPTVDKLLEYLEGPTINMEIIKKYASDIQDDINYLENKLYAFADQEELEDEEEVITPS